MSKPYLLLALIPFLANCSAIAAVASSLLGQCEDFSSDELNVDLNEECRGLQDFLEDNQDNLPSLTGVLSVRESGSQTDASLLITDSSGNPIDDLTTVQVAAEASADGSNFQSVTISSVDQYEDLANSEADTDHFSFVTIMDYSASILSSDLDDVYDGLGDLFENLAPIYRGGDREILNGRGGNPILHGLRLGSAGGRQYHRAGTGIYVAIRRPPPRFERSGGGDNILSFCRTLY